MYVGAAFRQPHLSPMAALLICKPATAIDRRPRHPRASLTAAAFVDLFVFLTLFGHPPASPSAAPLTPSQPPSSVSRHSTSSIALHFHMLPSRLVTTSLTPVMSACRPSTEPPSDRSTGAAMSAPAAPKALEATETGTLTVPGAPSCSHKRTDADAAAASAASSSSSATATAASADSSSSVHPSMAGHFAQLSLNHYNGTAPAPSPSPANSPIAPYDMTPMSFKRHKIEVLNAGRSHHSFAQTDAQLHAAAQPHRPHTCSVAALLCVRLSRQHQAQASAHPRDRRCRFHRFASDRAVSGAHCSSAQPSRRRLRLHSEVRPQADSTHLI